MKKELFITSVLLALCTAVILPAHAESETEPISYIDEDGYTQELTEYQILDPDHYPDTADLALEPGWYVVKGNVTYSNRIQINAQYDPELAEEYELEPVSIVLADGCTLNLNQGIHLEQDYGLFIYSQKDSTGVLNAEYNDDENDSFPHAVIGGHYGCGGLASLTITDSRVAAFGRYATVSLEPCAMMTHGTLTLGDNMKVSAGYDPDHITPYEKDRRIEAIRSNVFALVEEEGFQASSEPSQAATVLGNNFLSTLLLIGAGIAFVIAGITIARKKAQKA